MQRDQRNAPPGKGTAMLQQERHTIIREQLQRHGAVEVHELAVLMQVSDSTVRRDIQDLADAGVLKKVFGGAVLPDKSKRIIAREQEMTEKAAIHVDEKRAIAAYAATLVNDDDFVYIDAGTSTGLLVECLENDKATYVTNGIRHAMRLAERGFGVIILSGRPKPTTEAVSGIVAAENMKQYHFTKAFLGTNGITEDAGLTTPDLDEAIVKTEAIRHAYITYILADSSKFGVETAVTFGQIKDCCLLTDRCPEEKYKAMTIVKEVID